MRHSPRPTLVPSVAVMRRNVVPTKPGSGVKVQPLGGLATAHPSKVPLPVTSICSTDPRPSRPDSGSSIEIGTVTGVPGGVSRAPPATTGAAPPSGGTGVPTWISQSPRPTSSPSVTARPTRAMPENPGSGWKVQVVGTTSDEAQAVRAPWTRSIPVRSSQPRAGPSGSLKSIDTMTGVSTAVVRAPPLTTGAWFAAGSPTRISQVPVASSSPSLTVYW